MSHTRTSFSTSSPGSCRLAWLTEASLVIRLHRPRMTFSCANPRLLRKRTIIFRSSHASCYLSAWPLPRSMLLARHSILRHALQPDISTDQAIRRRRRTRPFTAPMTRSGAARTFMAAKYARLLAHTHTPVARTLALLRPALYRPCAARALVCTSGPMPSWSLAAADSPPNYTMLSFGVRACTTKAT